MTQCTTCLKWYHNECVDIDSEVSLSIWPCPPCRSMSTHLIQLISMVSQLAATVDKIQANMKSIHQLSSSTNEDVKNTKQCLDVTKEEIQIIKQKSDETLNEIKPASERIGTLCTARSSTESLLQSLDQRTKQIVDKFSPELEQSDEETDDDEEDCAIKADGNLLIGDSMIRNVVPLSKDLTIESHGGANFSDIRKCLKQINPKKKRLQNIYIVCGTNDVSTKRRVAKIAKDCERLLCEAKPRAEKVYLSSIMPRLDEASFTEKIDALNETLSTLATSQSATFINNDRNFKYRDNTADSNLLIPTDRLHLSHQGVKKLLQNLQLDEQARASPENLATNGSNQLQNATSTNINQKMDENPTWLKPLSDRSNCPLPPSVPQPTMSCDQRQHRFRGGRSPLSNFYETQMTMWGISFRSSEQCYQYSKAISMNDHLAANEILRARAPREAKAVGDRIHTDDRWRNMRVNSMSEILQEKARQCKQFREHLEHTQPETLIEDTEHEFWGRGKHGQGHNMLGHLLMRLRDDLLKSTHIASPSSLQNSPAYQRDQIRCFNCGEQSHTILRCRHSRPLRCFSCQMEGHKQKSCTQRTRGDVDYRRFASPY